MDIIRNIVIVSGIIKLLVEGDKSEERKREELERLSKMEYMERQVEINRQINLQMIKNLQ